MVSKKFIDEKHTTHSGGKGEYLHDWYPYLEGFSSSFVRELINKYNPTARTILEPFAGVGTTPLFCGLNNIDCYYCEINPVLRFIIDVKINIVQISKSNRYLISEKVKDIKENIETYAEKCNACNTLYNNYKEVFGESKFFYDDNFEKILRLRKLIDNLKSNELLVSKILEIAVLSCLLKCSLLKRNGDVRFKTDNELKKGVPELYDEVKKQLNIMLDDFISLPVTDSKMLLLSENSKLMLEHNSINADMVITSPPYLNGTNYFRNTKLELWFLRELKNKNSLRLFRDQVVTSGINDVTKDKCVEVLPIVKDLFEELKLNAYDSRIPKMVSAYFYEMKTVIKGLIYHTKENGIICIDIGDSIYSNIYIPTNRILTSIAVDLGLEYKDEIVLRKRKSKNGNQLSQYLLVFRR